MFIVRKISPHRPPTQIHHGWDSAVARSGSGVRVASRTMPEPERTDAERHQRGEQRDPDVAGQPGVDARLDGDDGAHDHGEQDGNQRHGAT
jgi:hypothetical protein